jgi:hypothetical protein
MCAQRLPDVWGVVQKVTCLPSHILFIGPRLQVFRVIGFFVASEIMRRSPLKARRAFRHEFSGNSRDPGGSSLLSTWFGFVWF